MSRIKSQTSIRQKSFDCLKNFHETNNSVDYLTATQVAKRLGIGPDNVSSVLKKMFDEGLLYRIENFGPRGGFGYRYKPQ